MYKFRPKHHNNKTSLSYHLNSKESLPPRRQKRQGYYKKKFTVEIAEMRRT